MNTRWKGISCSHLYVRQAGCYLKDWMNTSGLWLAEHCATFSSTAACAVVLTFENSGSSIKTQEWKCFLWLRCVNSNANCSVPGFISINNWHVWTTIFKWIRVSIVDRLALPLPEHAHIVLVLSFVPHFSRYWTFFVALFISCVHDFYACFSQSWMLLICVDSQIIFWQLSLKAQVSRTSAPCPRTVKMTWLVTEES